MSYHHFTIEEPYHLRVILSKGASPRRTFAGRSMNSPSASNGSFCGGNAADLQSKLPKTLSERAKARSGSDEGN